MAFLGISPVSRKQTETRQSQEEEEMATNRIQAVHPPASPNNMTIPTRLWVKPTWGTVPDVALCYRNGKCGLNQNIPRIVINTDFVEMWCVPKARSPQWPQKWTPQWYNKDDENMQPVKWWPCIMRLWHPAGKLRVVGSCFSLEGIVSQQCYNPWVSFWGRRNLGHCGLLTLGEPYNWYMPVWVIQELQFCK